MPVAIFSTTSSGSKMFNVEKMQMLFLTPFDEMPAGVWVQLCCRHVCYKSTLISAGQGRHRSAMTAPVNVWTKKDTSDCQQEQANIPDVDQFVFLFCSSFFFFGLARLGLCSHPSYKFTSEFKHSNLATCHTDAR